MLGGNVPSRALLGKNILSAWFSTVLRMFFLRGPIGKGYTAAFALLSPEFDSR